MLDAGSNHTLRTTVGALRPPSPFRIRDHVELRVEIGRRMSRLGILGLTGGAMSVRCRIGTAVQGMLEQRKLHR